MTGMPINPSMINPAAIDPWHDGADGTGVPDVPDVSARWYLQIVEEERR